MYIDEYIDCLKAQVPLYKRLDAEITMQEEAIIAEDYAKLNEVLVQKDAMLRQIDVIEQRAVLLRAELMRRHSLRHFNLTELGGVYSEGRLAPLKEVMAELKVLMKSMIDKEKCNEDMLRDKMDVVEEGMRQLRVGKRVNNAYKSLNTAFGASAFMDKKQ